MEIKIQCACGEKYKFEVEPIRGRMPAPVSCPSCGADGTVQANEIIRAGEAPPPSAGSVPPITQPTTAPPPARLRISPSAATPGGAPPPIAPVASRYAPPPLTAMPPRPGAKAQSRWMKTATSILVAVTVGFGVLVVSYRWFHRLRAIAEVAGVLKESGNEAASAANEHQNLDFEDAVILFVAHSNHMVVVEACQDYWRDKLHKKLTVVPDTAVNADGDYQLIPAHNGFVRIMGGLEWPQAQYEGLAEYLSQRFGTLVFEARDVDFTGAYHFGVYDHGARKFHAQMDVKIVKGEAEETVTTEGNDWALANGYTPGPDGFNDFHLGDADQITQRLGLKLWDEPGDVELKGVLLKE